MEPEIKKLKKSEHSWELIMNPGFLSRSDEKHLCFARKNVTSFAIDYPAFLQLQILIKKHLSNKLLFVSLESIWVDSEQEHWTWNEGKYFAFCPLWDNTTVQRA